jgi:hypothetical protein
VNCVGQQSLLFEGSARTLCRFGRSVLDCASRVLHPTHAGFGLLRMVLWKRPGPCAFCLQEASGFGVFRECPRGTTSRLPAATAFAAPQRQVRASGRALPGLGAPLCVGYSRLTHPTGVGRGVAVPRLPRFTVPRAASPLESGTRVEPSIEVAPDVGFPPHLPPLAFLRPPTACSSSRLACPVSYRHHLWDSKNTNN